MSVENYAPRPAHVRWLLDSDPAIRWQVMRDLTGEAPEVVAAERARVVKEGWGAQFLAAQSRQGNFGGVAANGGLLPTLYALEAFKGLGPDPASAECRRMTARVAKNLRFAWHDNRRFFDGEVEPCINGRILGLGAYFHEPNETLLRQLLREQLADGGWNCEAPKSQVSSFHSTICVLEGLLDYERIAGKSAVVTRARKRGEKYLLERRMFRSLRTGEVIEKRWLRFAYPPFWHYDVLRGLDYLRGAGVAPDEQMNEAVAVVMARRHQNGRWPLNLIHKEQLPVEMETEAGRASRWNTLRALRVLKWFGAFAC